MQFAREKGSIDYYYFLRPIEDVSVRMISTHQSPMALARPLTDARCALIGGAQPHLVGGPLSHALYRVVGAGGTRYEVALSCHTPH
jgi:hypothetical protein